MKPFNLEEAKVGKPVCTRNGNKVRIVCFNCKNEDYPIVALVLIGDGERVITYSKEGNYYCDSNDQDGRDLMIADTVHEGYINIYKNKCGTYTGTIIYESEEKAKNYRTNNDCYITTIKIQWKE